jgi:putative membrane protein
MHYYYPMADGYDWGFGLLMAMFWFFIVMIVIVAIVRLLRAGKLRMIQTQDPLDIVKERYAKGEITREQFEQFKKDLKG